MRAIAKETGLSPFGAHMQEDIGFFRRLHIVGENDTPEFAMTSPEMWLSFASAPTSAFRPAGFQIVQSHAHFPHAETLFLKKSESQKNQQLNLKLSRDIQVRKNEKKCEKQS